MQQSQFQIGDKITITKTDMLGELGSVQYIGPLEGKEGVYFGVALDKPLGNHNGQFKDKVYFSCIDKHGIFIFEKYLKLQDDKSEVKSTDTKVEVKKEERKEERKKTLTSTLPKKTEDPKIDVKPKLKEVIPKVIDKKDTVKDKKEDPKKPEIKKTEQKQDAKQELKQEQEVKKQAPSKQEQVEQSQQISTTQSSMLDTSYSQDNDILLTKIKDLEVQDKSKANVINSLQSTIEQLKDELGNIKEAQAAFLLVNTDLKGQIATQKRKIELLEQTVPTTGGSEDELHELNSLVEILTMENENMKQKLDSQKKTLDNQSVELKRLKEEKELKDLELEEAILTAGENLQYEDGGSLANQDIVQANSKLRQALQLQSAEFDLMRAENEMEILQYQDKLQFVPQLTEKAKLVDKLQTQLVKKDEEIEELSQRVDESSQLSAMFEKLTESILKKDEMIQNLKRQEKEMKENQKLDEEINADLEDTCKVQELQIKNLEFDIYELNRKQQESNQEIEERDSIITRLKTKIGQINKQLDLIKDEQPSEIKLESVEQKDVAQGGSKAQELIAKYQEVVTQRREMYKRFLKLQIENSDIRNEVLLKGVLLIRSIPQEYQYKLKFNLIDPLAQVRKVGEKSQLLADEFIQNVDTHGDQLIKEENQDLGFWMSDAVKHLNTLTNLSLTLSSMIENISQIEPVEKMARNGVLINQFKMAGSQVDEFIRLVSEDKLSSKESISGFQVIIGHIQEDMNTLLSQNEEFKQSPEYEGILVREKLQNFVQLLNNAIFNGRLMREQELQRKVNKDSYKVDQLVETVLKRGREHLKIMSSYRQSWGTFEAFKGKNGKYYDQLSQNLVEILQILEEKLNFETSNAFITGQSNEDVTVNEPYYQTYRDRCISLAHVLNLLNQNLGSVGQQIEELVDEFSSNHKSQQNTKVSHKNTQSNLHCYGKTSSWGSISQAMAQQLQEIQFTIESEKRLKEELDISLQEKKVMSNEMFGLKKAREALEQRIVELQQKADRVQLLENDKRRFLEKIQGFTEATELTRRELENYESKCKELEEERDNLEQLINVYKSALSSNNNTNVNENAEKIISRSNTRMQSRLQKYVEVNKQQDSAAVSQQRIEIESKISDDGGTINKVLWREIQELRDRELRKTIINITSGIEKPKQNVEISDAVIAIRKLRSLKLREMATAKIIRLGDPIVNNLSLKQDAIKIFSVTMKSLNIETSKQYYDDRLLLQIQSSQVQKHLIVEKSTLINTLYEVLK